MIEYTSTFLLSSERVARSIGINMTLPSLAATTCRMIYRSLKTKGPVRMDITETINSRKKENPIQIIINPAFED